MNQPNELSQRLSVITDKELGGATRAAVESTMTDLKRLLAAAPASNPYVQGFLAGISLREHRVNEHLPVTSARDFESAGGGERVLASAMLRADRVSRVLLGSLESLSAAGWQRVYASPYLERAYLVCNALNNAGLKPVCLPGATANFAVLVRSSEVALSHEPIKTLEEELGWSR